MIRFKLTSNNSAQKICRSRSQAHVKIMRVGQWTSTSFPKKKISSNLVPGALDPHNGGSGTDFGENRKEAKNLKNACTSNRCSMKQENEIQNFIFVFCFPTILKNGIELPFLFSVLLQLLKTKFELVFFFSVFNLF